MGRIKLETTAVGIDIGSTTAKLVIIKDGAVVYERYERHYSRVRMKTLELLKDASEYLEGETFSAAISGSAGLGLARVAGIPFVQEVFATSETVKKLAPDTSAVIELGGEDAKIIFFEGGTDERMNGTCAGGTGAFIDQMATLLDVSVSELDRLSLSHDRIYPIASRCGVFAKTDIQPLLNQGARKEDIAASIYQAVVNQTIVGLAQGREIKGKVMFLGGPLHYCLGLRERFTETLKLDPDHALFPDYGLFAVALGTAIYSVKDSRRFTYGELVSAVESAANAGTEVKRTKPLFETEKDYEEFENRHAKATVPNRDIAGYSGKAYLGIDCGSTTTKLCLLSEDDEILYSFYDSNRGNPVEIVKNELLKIYSLCDGRITLAGCAVTGYGEELIKNAFGVDHGVVETIAHFTAARHFDPHVDFIIDIGGQDIKCFKIRSGAIDSISLNEACSSGCGSFIETFAKSMGYSVEDFARKGLFARSPVELGTRCTVFMNSSVKEAQKDGASVEDISAGLCASVVKNAIYKVIRAADADELGKNIVVQGGTFLNDAVLRCFELEIGRNVIRPAIAGLMGAYGAALYAKSLSTGKSAVLSEEELRSFEHTAKSAVCRGCTNNCHLTVNTFSGGRRFISGNQCERGLSLGSAGSKTSDIPNLHEFKRNTLRTYCTDARYGEDAAGREYRGTVGLPMALGMYELLPLWFGIFDELGYRVILSEKSTKATYEKGQFSIPSDTACYPAKIMHGHVESLIESGAEYVFYPCLTYNVNEKAGDNHYNCPVVAYYSELLKSNMPSLSKVKFLYPYLNINDRRETVRELKEFFAGNLASFTKHEIKRAVDRGFAEYDGYMAKVRAEGERAVAFARENNMRIMILAGRPYHADPEIGHGIDRLACSLGFAVVSEDSIAHLGKRVPLHVLNQWTYHTRLYRAAEYATSHNDAELVQLVSFGCGIDAITTDEVRSILENSGKLYTQIKIDEITNLGAVRIRLRSLIGALDERSAKEV